MIRSFFICLVFSLPAEATGVEIPLTEGLIQISVSNRDGSVWNKKARVDLYPSSQTTPTLDATGQSAPIMLKAGRYRIEVKPASTGLGCGATNPYRNGTATLVVKKGRRVALQKVSLAVGLTAQEENDELMAQQARLRRTVTFQVTTSQGTPAVGIDVNCDMGPTKTTTDVNGVARCIAAGAFTAHFSGSHMASTVYLNGNDASWDSPSGEPGTQAPDESIAVQLVPVTNLEIEVQGEGINDKTPMHLVLNSKNDSRDVDFIGTKTTLPDVKIERSSLCVTAQTLQGCNLVTPKNERQTLPVTFLLGPPGFVKFKVRDAKGEVSSPVVYIDRYLVRPANELHPLAPGQHVMVVNKSPAEGNIRAELTFEITANSKTDLGVIELR
jgi:hypothetical protein